MRTSELPAVPCDIYHILLDEGLLSSDQLINVAQDYKIADKTLEDVLTKMYERAIFDTPEEAEKYVEMDDFYKQADSILYLMTQKGMEFEEAYHATLQNF